MEDFLRRENVGIRDDCNGLRGKGRNFLRRLKTRPPYRFRRLHHFRPLTGNSDVSPSPFGGRKDLSRILLSETIPDNVRFNLKQPAFLWSPIEKKRKFSFDIFLTWKIKIKVESRIACRPGERGFWVGRRFGRGRSGWTQAATKSTKTIKETEKPTRRRER